MLAKEVQPGDEYRSRKGTLLWRVTNVRIVNLGYRRVIEWENPTGGSGSDVYQYDAQVPVTRPGVSGQRQEADVK